MLKSTVFCRVLGPLFKVVGVYVLLLLLPGCKGSEPGAGSEPTASVGITLSQAKTPQGKTSLSAVKIADITSLTVTARSETGNELARAQAAIREPGATMTLTLNVPVGANRIFLAEAQALTGQVILSGEAVTDLQEGVPVTLTIPVAPPLQITPENPTVDLGKKQVFTAHRGSLMKDALEWFVDSISGGNDQVGTIAPTGDNAAEYTAPAGASASSVKVRVASVLDPTLYFDETGVTLNDPAKTLFVDPAAGADSATCGGQTAKCKTLSHALSLAQAGGTVLLEPTGPYVFSRAIRNETLPLEMKAGVSIRSASQTDRAFLDFTNILTIGPGIIGADDAVLAGMRIEMHDGFGNLIETRSTSSKIQDNLILGRCRVSSDCDSVAVFVQGGSPMISGNTFGASDPGGFDVAVKVEGDAVPQILDNTFTGNQRALFIGGSAAPKLEENLILQNGEGVVIAENGLPDLGGGAARSAGLNILSCNTTVDLFNNTSHPIFARNNQWDHVPPSTNVPGEDIDIARPSGTVDAAGASLYAFAPCNIGIRVSAPSPAFTTENGGTAFFEVVLGTQPTADVSVGLSSSDTTEGTVSVSTLTFTTANWDTAQSVTVSGVDDNVDDGDVRYNIVTTVSTSDPVYSQLNPDDVSVTNSDNDSALHTLTVRTAGTGRGTVTSTPAGITCGQGGQDCTEVYSAGTQVQLRASADKSSVFSRWSGDCSAPGPVASVTMNGDRTCVAEFRLVYIFKANFDSDTVAKPPNVNPPAQGDQVWDHLELLTGQNGSILVQGKVGDLGKQPLLLDSPARTTGPVSLRGFVEGKPSTGGVYIVRWRSLLNSAPFVNEPAAIGILDSTGVVLGVLTYHSGNLLDFNNISPQEGIGVRWALDILQGFEVIVDLDKKALSLAIDGTAVPGFQGISFLSQNAVDLAEISVGVNVIQRMGVDDIEVLVK